MQQAVRASRSRLRVAGLSLSLSVIIVITGMIGSLPWWSFIIPVMIAGVLIEQMIGPVPGFFMGFVGGFVAWLGATVYFYYSLHSMMLARIGALAGVPDIVVILIPGILAGLLSGLALYVGQSMRRGIKTGHTGLK